MPHAASALRFVTSQALIDELRRRSLGCLIATVRAEEKGDTWRHALKGSPILLGALSASLSLEIDKSLAASPAQSGGPHERRTSLRRPGAA